MAKKALLTIDGTHRKVKKGLLTIDGTHRKVKKGFVTLGGVHRPCWGAGLEYYGAITPLSIARSQSAAAVTGRYAMVVGGLVASSEATSAIEYYDEELTHFSGLTFPNAALRGIGSASLGDMAVFAGGRIGNGATCSGAVHGYDASLTRTRAENGLASTRYSVCGGSVGDHAVFVGGINGSSTRYNDIHFYDRSLTRTRITDQFLDAYAASACAANVGSYLICNVGAQIFSINEDLTKKTIGNGTYTRHYGEYAASVEDYAVFAGGINSSQADDDYLGLAVDTVDASLTLSKAATTISTLRSNGGLAASLNGFALFAGGEVCTDVLDNNLTNTIKPAINHGNDGCSETLGDYALFFGGVLDSVRLDAVDAFVYL